MGWGEHPGKREGEGDSTKAVGESFLTFSVSKNKGLLVGSCREYLYIWDLYSADKDERLRYKYHTSVFPNNIITAVHADDDFLIVGDNDGRVMLLDTEGNDVYRLNTPRFTGCKVDIESIPISQLGIAFRNKVSKISRTGRWVTAAFENGRVELFDIFTPDAIDPVDVYINQDAVGGSGSSLRDLQVNGTECETTMLYSGGKDMHTGKTHTRPGVILWFPRRSNGEGVFTKEDDKLTGGIIEIINAALSRARTKIVGLLERKKAEAASLALEDLKESFFPPKVIPFFGFQKIIRNLDDLETYLGKIMKSGNSSKYKKHINECVAQHKRLIGLVKASIRYINKNCRVKSNEMGPLRLSRVQHAAKASTLREKDYTHKEGDTLGMEKKSKGYRRTDPISEMLERVCESLKVSHTELGRLTEKFDIACNNGISNSEAVKPLLEIYQMLNQMREDTKEMGKRAGAIGEELLDKWYENGGDYKEALVPASSK